MKGVIYARYSSDHQREESIEGQIRECTAFAEKNGITLLHTYIDRAYSATNDNRPAFQEMIKDSHKKMFDYFGKGFSIEIDSAIEWLNTEPQSLYRDVLIYQLSVNKNLL